MNNKLLSYSKEELEQAIELITIRDTKSLVLGDKITISYHSTFDAIHIDSEYDGIVLRTEHISKLKLFLDCFDVDGNWIGIKTA
jgi:hypothetical protein